MLLQISALQRAWGRGAEAAGQAHSSRSDAYLRPAEFGVGMWCCARESYDIGLRRRDAPEHPLPDRQRA